MAHQSAVAPFFTNGVSFNVSAVVSADRRYVRLSLNPVFTHIGGRGGSPNNPLLPGGNGSRP
jgi:hypothetical protein